MISNWQFQEIRILQVTQCHDDASNIPSITFNFVPINQLTNLDKDAIIGKQVYFHKCNKNFTYHAIILGNSRYNWCRKIGFRRHNNRIKDDK